MTFARRNPRIGAIVRVNISDSSPAIFVLVVCETLYRVCVLMMIDSLRFLSALLLVVLLRAPGKERKRFSTFNASRLLTTMCFVLRRTQLLPFSLSLDMCSSVLGVYSMR